jgi:hypothetical protein
VAVELVRDLQEMEYENTLKKLINERDPMKVILDPQDKTAGDLGKTLRSVVASLTAGTVGVRGAMPMSIRQLARKQSNPEESDPLEEERKSTWAQAQQLRKKKAQLCLWTGKTHESLKALVEKTAAKSFEGKLNETHRLWMLSCDLFTESKGTWQKPPVVGNQIDIVLEFFKKSNMKEHDIVLCFDGTESQNRDYVLQSMGQSVGNFVILYESRQRQSRHRKIFCSSQKVEHVVMKLHVPRVRLSVKSRDDDYCPPVKKGESVTTHDLNLVGVPAPSPRPMISPVEKSKIWPGVDEPPKYRASTVPCFWAESKPVELWEVLLQSLDAGCVVDLSPGSGALAVACMTVDVPYIGISRHEVHHSWLANVLDRECLKLLADSEWCLYDESLSELVQKHFAEVLDELNEVDCRDDEEESDNEGEEDL